MIDLKYNDNSGTFQLIRTNPKLSGNVKLVVYDDRLWLNAINVNDTLSNDKFQRYPLDMVLSYSENLSLFLNQISITNDIIFKNADTPNVKLQSYNYSDQFYTKFYYSSVNYVNSKFYNKKYSAFAPLYLNGDLPKYFVVFKLDGAISDRLDNINLDLSNDDIVKDVLYGAKILKVFDLSDNTAIGKYINGIVKDVNTNESDLIVDYKNNTIVWNGYSIDYGVITGHMEYVYDIFSKDKPLIDFEEYIIDGYSKYGLIYPKILNMEYMFDDESDLFDFNRYFGMYVDDIDMAKLLLDYDNVINKKGTNYTLYRKYNFYDDIKNEIVGIPDLKIKEKDDFELEDLISNPNKEFYSYIKTKQNRLVSLEKYNEFSNDDVNVKTDVTFDDLFGVDDKILEIDSKLLDKPGHSFVHMKLLSDLAVGDKFIFYHPTGSQVDTDGRLYDVIEIGEIPGYVDNSGDYYVYLNIYEINTTPPITHNYYILYGKGENNTMSKVVSAFVDVINSISSRMFEAYHFDNNIIIKSISSGSDELLSIQYVSTVSYNNVIIDDLTGTDLDGTEIKFRGGTKVSNRFLINKSHTDYILENKSEIYIKTDKGLSRIKDVVKYSDGVGSDDTFISDFDKYAVCLIENEDIPLFDETYISIYKEYRPSVGLLSFRKIKDFDYDFINTAYNRIPYWEIYNYFSIPAGLHLLKSGVYYKVVGDGSITYEGNVINSNDNLSSVFAGNVNDYFEVNDGHPVVIYSDVDTSGNTLVDVPLYDENGNIKDFYGYFMFRSMPERIDYYNNDDYNYNKRFYEHLLTSEYNAYKENYNVDLSVKSRINPYISKWGYKSGTDSRDNIYRLNIHNVFGEYNMSPSHTRFKADSNLLTHEYFYIISKYENFNDSSIIKDNYLYFDEDFNFDIYNGSRDEFLNYFNYVPTFNNKQIGTLQKRYSLIKYNMFNDVNETMFKGVKYVFDGPVDGYLFSVVLHPIEKNYDEYKNPIDVELITNTKGKYILLYIKLYLESYDNIDFTIDDITKSNYKTIYSTNGFKVEGDYRNKFSNGIGNLTLLGLYSMYDAKFNNKIDRFSTINTPIEFELDKIRQFNNTDYNLPVVINKDNLSLFMTNVKPSNYLKMLFGSTTGFLNYNELDVNGRNPIKTINSDMCVISKYPNENFVISDINNNILYTYPFNVNPNKVSQIKGGRAYYSKLFNQLAFANIKEIVNDNKLTLFGDINIRIISPDAIVKNSVINVVSADYKPEGYEYYNDVHYSLLNKESSTYTMHRYGGKYEPLFKNIIDFKYSFDFDNAHNVSTYNSMKNCGIELLETDKSGIIENFGIIKVSDKSILSLNKDIYGNSYPLIGESAIDYVDFNIFKSDWAGELYYKYTDKMNKSLVYGTYNLYDLNLFVNKKLMIPDSYDLYNYDIQNTQSDDLSDIKSIYYIDKGVHIVFNLENIIIDTFMRDGFYNNIAKYLPDDVNYLNGYTLEEYSNKYLKNNIVELYDLGEVLIYYKYISKSIDSVVHIPQNSDDVDMLLDNGYEIMKDVNINKEGTISSVVINENINYNFDIYVVLKINMI